MCEFKVVKEKDGTQLAEDVVIMHYNDDHELLLKDILGTGKKMESALLYDVNTMNQTTKVLEHPLIKDFVALVESLVHGNSVPEEIEAFQAKLEAFK